MTAVNQPSIAFLSPLHFDVTLTGIPNVQFMTTAVDIPGISLSNPAVATPFNPFYAPADKMAFDELSIQFKVDDQAANWLQIFDWMNSIGFPATFKQRAAVEANNGVQVLRSDMTVILQDFKKNPALIFTFMDVLPVRLSGMNLDASATSVNYVTSIAQFQYRQYTVTQVANGDVHPNINR